ncbi:MAG: TlpA disulfide reductase family protein [Paracoccaceae bacterium]
MKKFWLALVYTALALGANPAISDIAELEALRSGDMKKLIFQRAPQPVPTTEFVLQDDGGIGTLADFRGQYVLLNFWATWCAPCRKEMPMLSELQTEFGGDNFKVVTIATGRNSPAGIKKFFDDIGIDNLPRHQDAKQELARKMGIFGLPITVIIDPKGNEVARLRGDADWASDSAKAILLSMLEPNGDT